MAGCAANCPVGGNHALPVLRLSTAPEAGGGPSTAGAHSEKAQPTVESDYFKRIQKPLHDESKIRWLMGHEDRCFDVAFHPSSDVLASASQDSKLCLWDVDSGNLLKKLDHESEVLRVSWATPAEGVVTDTTFLCSASATGRVRVFTVNEELDDAARTAKKLNVRQRLELHHREDAQIYACKFVDAKTLLTASDNIIHFWDVESESEIGEWAYDALPGNASVFGGEARNPENICYVFDVEEGQLSNDAGQTVFVALSDGSVRIQDRRSARSVATLCRSGSAHLTALRLNPRLGVLVACGGNGECTVWDVNNFAVRGTLQGHQRSVFGADFLSSLECPNSSQLMTWSTDCSIRVWDIEKVNGPTRAIDSVYHMGFPIFSCSINHWGDKIVVGGGSGDACCEGEAVPSLLVHDIN